MFLIFFTLKSRYWVQGVTKKVRNGNVVTYIYNEKATLDSEERVLAFSNKIINTLK